MANRSLPNYYSKIKKRLAAKVRRVRSTGCWEWQGCRHQNGYGRIGFKGKGCWAHRVAFEVHNGYAPTLNVLHSCDNPPCINPAHLHEGTMADNMRERDARGRAGWQVDPKGWAEKMRLSRIKRRRLSDAQVDDLRRRYCAGEKAKTLAVEFGVCFEHVPRIAKGLLYKFDANGKEMPLYPPSERVHKLFRQ